MKKIERVYFELFSKTSVGFTLSNPIIDFTTFTGAMFKNIKNIGEYFKIIDIVPHRVDIGELCDFIIRTINNYKHNILNHIFLFYVEKDDPIHTNNKYIFIATHADKDGQSENFELITNYRQDSCEYMEISKTVANYLANKKLQ